jgi:hypothetical protein
LQAALVQIGGWSIRTAIVEERGVANYQPAKEEIAKLVNKKEEMVLQIHHSFSNKKTCQEAAR